MTAVLCAPIGLAVLILRIARLLEKEEKNRQAAESPYGLTELSHSSRRFAEVHRVWHTGTEHPQLQECIPHTNQNRGYENYNAETIAAISQEDRCDRDLQMAGFPPSYDESVQVPHIRVEESSPTCGTTNIVFTIGDEENIHI